MLMLLTKSDIFRQQGSKNKSPLYITSHFHHYYPSMLFARLAALLLPALAVAVDSAQSGKPSTGPKTTTAPTVDLRQLTADTFKKTVAHGAWWVLPLAAAGHLRPCGHGFPRHGPTFMRGVADFQARRALFSEMYVCCCDGAMRTWSGLDHTLERSHRTWIAHS